VAEREGRVEDLEVSAASAAPARSTACLSCGDGGLVEVLSLGALPLANAYPAPADSRDEARFPLDLALCPACGLVQLRHVVPPEAMFSDYLYFSSYSASMLTHAAALAQSLVAERGLGAGSLVMEVASNDGYLLQYFAAAGVPVLGIEPAANVAAVARDTRKIPTLVEWFGRDLGRRLAAEGTKADVILGLNVMAHVPDFNGFLAGLASLLKPEGVAVIEAPYVRDMVEKTEFDTIYHEHLFYFSVSAVAAAAARHGLVVQRVERVPVHGGSLRLFLGRGASHGPTAQRLLEEEAALGLTTPAYYAGFRRAVERIRTDLVALIARLRREGASIAGYGAAAKATILLNYCGLSPRDIDFVADRSPHKQGRRMPGSGIPILGSEAIAERRPDYVVLFVWNIKDEVMRQEDAYRRAGGRFIVAVPEVRIE
jgi:SAM-dependent methyltransferase